jgi:hypothetical protein
MRKRLPYIAAACLIGLTACGPTEPPPPPRYWQDSSFDADSASPMVQSSDVSSPTDPAISSPTTAPSGLGSYPIAQRTANPDQVISPYEPFNVIDVSGFASGKLARDPSNQKIFRIP